MINIIAYRVIFNGTNRIIKEEYTCEDATDLELLRASLKVKFKAMYIDFIYKENVKKKVVS